MSRALYESLFDADHSADPDLALVAALAQAGKVRKAAYDLATDEMLEGLWVEEMVDESEIRLAADDRSETLRTLSGGGYSVEVVRGPDGSITATQTEGPGGASLKIDDQWIVVQPGVPVDVPLQALPDALTLVDLKGKQHTLS